MEANERVKIYKVFRVAFGDGGGNKALGSWFSSAISAYYFAYGGGWFSIKDKNVYDVCFVDDNPSFAVDFECFYSDW